MKLLFAAVAVAAALCFCFTVQAEETLLLTLPGALELAQRQNIDIALAELEVEKFNSQYWQALGNVFPSINLSGNFTKNQKRPVVFFGGESVKIGSAFSAVGGVSLEQPLYTGGKVAGAIRAAGGLRQIKEDALRATRQETTFAVKRLFYGVFLAQSVVDIEQENLATAEDHLKTIRERFNQGLDSDLVVRRQEVEVANARTEFIRARNLLETALLNMRDVLRLGVDQPVMVAGSFEALPSIAPAYEPFAGAAFDNRPEVSAARGAVRSARALVSFYGSAFRPSLGAFANYQWAAQSDKADFSPRLNAESMNGGLALRFNLFQGGQDRQVVRQARMDVEKARLVQEKTERAVQREVREKWLALILARDSALVQADAVGQASAALKAVEVRYREGQAGQLELNDAAFALNRVRLQHAQAVQDYWVNLAALERAAGISF